MSIIYLACPYSHPQPVIRLARYHAATRAAGELIKRGHVVFSPITHGHSIAEAVDLPTDISFWRRSCYTFISRCSRVVVLKVEGWDISVGVQDELLYAAELGLPVEYMEPV